MTRGKFSAVQRNKIPAFSAFAGGATGSEAQVASGKGRTGIHIHAYKQTCAVVLARTGNVIFNTWGTHLKRVTHAGKAAINLQPLILAADAGLTVGFAIVARGLSIARAWNITVKGAAAIVLTQPGLTRTVTYIAGNLAIARLNRPAVKISRSVVGAEPRRVPFNAGVPCNLFIACAGSAAEKTSGSVVLAGAVNAKFQTFFIDGLVLAGVDLPTVKLADIVRSAEAGVPVALARVAFRKAETWPFCHTIQVGTAIISLVACAGRPVQITVVSELLSSADAFKTGNHCKFVQLAPGPIPVPVHRIYGAVADTGNVKRLVVRRERQAVRCHAHSDVQRLRGTSVRIYLRDRPERSLADIDGVITIDVQTVWKVHVLDKGSNLSVSVDFNEHSPPAVSHNQFAG